MSTPSNSPFDKNMFLAILGALALYMGWQAYLGKKYPEYYTKKTTQKIEAEKTDVSPAVAAQSGKADATGKSPENPGYQATAPEVSTQTGSAEEKTLEFSDDIWRFVISSKGMGVKNIQLMKYTDRKDAPIQFNSIEGHYNFSTNVVGRARDLDFAISKTQDNQFTGVAQVGSSKIIKTVTVDSKNYSLQTQIRVENLEDGFAGITTEISDHIHPSQGGFFLMPQYEFQEFYTHFDGSSNERVVMTDKEVITKNFAKATLIALSSQYFTLAVHDKSSVIPDFRASSDAKGEKTSAVGLLTYSRVNATQDFNISYSAFAGPKSYRLLDSIDPDLAKIVNFGFFQAIAKVIFKVLDAIHNTVGNWGIAIVLLTILVRLLVLPFNLMSYRSMKGMAAIQPQMKVLREKYKNDAQRLNQEMLQLMKEAKANPLGGCLPMLLQIPVFFALYQVLGQSIELYKAPFIFWIHDLSFRDPFFVLPVLMGATLFIQQKITPSTMDPAQQKVMMFMPLIFSAFMFTLPSGLTLYIFVSGLFAVIQQYYFMRNDKKPAAA
ncbi:MAG: membrane protein insertase YidC [Bdellovibrionota bacterium]